MNAIGIERHLFWFSFPLGLVKAVGGVLHREVKLPMMLAREFYQQCTIEVARKLLGCILVRQTARGRRLSGKIVETEAYLGVDDPAAHSFNGPTKRSSTMFGPPGFSYIYFVYGMHHCLNVVTRPKGFGEAVLIRAIEPLEGLTKNRDTNGPGKLCRALQLTREHNGLDLCAGKQIWIEPGTPVENADVWDGPRVGIGYKHDAVHWPLRFGVAYSSSYRQP